MKGLEELLANFLLNYCKGDDYAEYRKECYSFWREKYGLEVVKKVRSIIAKKVSK